MSNSSSLSDLPIEERTRRKVTWRLLPFLLLLYLVAYIDRTNIGVAKLQMQLDLKFDNAIIGFGAGIFFWGYFLFEVPGTVIVEKWSARKWIARILFTWGLVAMGMGFIGLPQLSFIPVVNQFYFMRFLLGVAEAGFFPGVIVYISHWFRYADRGKAKARFMMAGPLATIIGVPLSRFILETVHWNSVPGWRWVFILEGIPAVLLGFVTLKYLTDRPQQAHWLAPEEREWLTTQLEAERASIADASRSASGAQSSYAQIALLTVVYFLGVTSIYGLTFFLPSITETMKGLSISGRTAVATLPYICSLAAMIFIGSNSDRTGERRWHMAIPLILYGTGLASSVLVKDHVGLTILCLTIAGFGMSTAWPAFWTLPAAFTTRASAAIAVGIINSVGNLGGYLGPSIVGKIREQTGSYATPVLVLSFFSFAAAFVALFVRRPPVRQESSNR